jgi:hypothetical protein
VFKKWFHHFLNTPLQWRTTTTRRLSSAVLKSIWRPVEESGRQML